jgi:UDP-N-acetylmuramoylalanine--D-glutamate ligase
LKGHFDEFKTFIKGKNVGVVGIGVSNTPLIRMLINLGAEVVACDKNPNIGEVSKELESLGVVLKLGEDYLESILDCQVIFRTPSLMPDNKYLVKALEKGIYVTSEMAEFMKYCPCKVFGVTGSDGKTTTTTLISEMLKKQGYNVFLGGNIGKPLFNEIEVINSEDFAVVELSSFQLMDINCSPQVGAITNLSPNHLDIHRDMDEYISAKKNIYLNQDKNDIIILNRDNEITYEMSTETLGKVRMFSLKDSSVFSYLSEDRLICSGKEICKLEDIKLPGMHNVENLLTAFCAVYDYVSIENMGYVATMFAGVEHRIEFVRELDGVRYYNGSIASSPTRTIADLNSFKGKVILIAGGYDKKLPFEELAVKGIDKIKTLVLIGDTRAKIRNAFEEEMKKRNVELIIIEAESLEDAVKIARNNSIIGDVITMSPACASFDMYKNFEIRGIAFKEIVNKL